MAKKKVAFDVKRGTIFNFDPDELVIIDAKDHPLYDPRVEKPISENFVRSIMAKGVIQPIVVRRDGPRAEVVAGRRRVRAARLANAILRERGEMPIMVPATVRRGDNLDAFEVALIENEQREDDSPIEKARKANRLLQMGRNDAQVADVFGVQGATIKIWVSLLDLHPKVQAAVEGGRISAFDAVRKLGSLSREDQVKALDDLEAIAEKSGSSNNSSNTNGNGKLPGKAVRQVVARHGGEAGTKPLPGKKLLRRMLDLAVEKADRENSEILSKRECAILRWIVGDIDEGRLNAAIPGMIPIIRSAEKAPPRVDA